jgi:hypothetical protein
MTTTSGEAMVTVRILEDLINAKKTDKGSIKSVINTLRSQIADMGNSVPEKV